ncbi:MAG: polyribonucleotide nucleotidyltransferase [Candidatus Nealsonbacteria bacterium]|nr:polyribonucleotide nucleotidyltransferase [Candidatus Nealsonbacteria bacterium]
MIDKTFKLEIGGKDLIVETKPLAAKANGSVTVRYGDTMVLATAVMSKTAAEQDFFPLTVEYEERYYAAGKILGSRFIRRESRPSDEAIITARAIDRAIRPRFPKNLGKEVQVVVTCLSWDGQNDPDILGLLAASLALSVSDIPWAGPIASLRIGRINNEFTINPHYEDREKSDLDFVLAAVSEDTINMIEMEGNETSEDSIMNAYEFAKPYLKENLEFQKEIAKQIGKEKAAVKGSAPDADFKNEIKDFLAGKLEKALYRPGGGMDEVESLREELVLHIEEKYSSGGKINSAKKLFDEELDKLIHKNILEKERRPDGRGLDEVRKLDIGAGVLPRTHGSGLFTRGETRALSILTLGAPSDVRLLEGMEIRGKKRFMHHYNFPPYSSGEIKPMRGPGRREIGHGMLAEKALLPLVPNFDDFPYTMRIVTEILSSNGSTSMASVTAASLALMDAGVPIKSPATGISVGLIRGDGENYKVIADIQGPEDHHGDMDFKVAGTKNGITAIQMDVKIDGINEKIMKDALTLARKSRLHILENLEKVLEKPRPNLSPWAPRIYVVQIRPEKIREVIGPGGKIINEIIEKCAVAIDIEDSGKIFVTAEKEEAALKAVEWIKNITREVKVGEIFQGKVKRILNFGAFVEILPGQEGMVHISQLAPYRVEKVEDIVKVGDMVPVKVISIDEQGRINLSIKEINNAERDQR